MSILRLHSLVEIFASGMVINVKIYLISLCCIRMKYASIIFLKYVYGF